MTKTKTKKAVIRLTATFLFFVLALGDFGPAWALDGQPLIFAADKAQQRLLSDPSLLEVPHEFCSLKEIYSAKKNSEPASGNTLILHIQDAHSNLSGQENLAKTLDDIMTHYQVSLVLVEGGSKNDTLTPVKKIAAAGIWDKVAKSFLVDAKISGEEYLNLTSGHPMKIMGIEDRGLYLKSVRAYADLADGRDASLEYLKRVRASLEKVKSRLYPQQLLDYEKAKKTAGEEYSVFLNLIRKYSSDLKKFPNLRMLVELKEVERGIDFDRANLERAALLNKLSERGLPVSRLAELMKTDGKKGALLFSNFQNILNIAKEKKVDLEGYPELLRYVSYLKYFSMIDLDAVQQEAGKAEDALYASALPSADSRLLRAVDRYLSLLVTAYSIQMTTKDFAFFRVNEPDYGTEAYLSWLNRKLVELGYVDDVIPSGDVLEKSKKSLEAFYESVSERDAAFIQNTDRILAEEKQSVAVLISGGYHTPHLKKLFQERGWSYAVMTPIVTGQTNQKKYEDVLLESVRGEKKMPTGFDASNRTEGARPEAALESSRLDALVSVAGQFSGSSRQDVQTILAAARLGSEKPGSSLEINAVAASAARLAEFTVSAVEPSQYAEWVPKLVAAAEDSRVRGDTAAESLFYEAAESLHAETDKVDRVWIASTPQGDAAGFYLFKKTAVAAPIDRDGVVEAYTGVRRDYQRSGVLTALSELGKDYRKTGGIRYLSVRINADNYRSFFAVYASAERQGSAMLQIRTDLRNIFLIDAFPDRPRGDFTGLDAVTPDSTVYRNYSKVKSDAEGARLAIEIPISSFARKGSESLKRFKRLRKSFEKNEVTGDLRDAIVARLKHVSNHHEWSEDDYERFQSRLNDRTKIYFIDATAVSEDDYLRHYFDPAENKLYINRLWVLSSDVYSHPDVDDFSIINEIIYPAKKIAVIGATGFIGSEIYGGMRKVYPEVIGTGHSRPRPGIVPLDATNESQIKDFFVQHQPDVVVYVSALANPDEAQNKPALSEALHAQAPKLIRKYFKGQLIYLSSDYVFRGDATEPYAADSRPEPIENFVYGQTKRRGEVATLHRASGRNAVLRLGYVFGKKGFVSEVVKKLDGELNPKKPFEFDDTRTRYPISVEDVGNAVNCIVGGELHGILQLNGRQKKSDEERDRADSVTKYQWAREIALNYFSFFPERIPKGETGESAVEKLIHPLRGTVAAVTVPAHTPMVNSFEPSRLLHRDSRWMQTLSRYGDSGLHTAMNDALQSNDAEAFWDAAGKLEKAGVHWALLGDASLYRDWPGKKPAVYSHDDPAAIQAVLTKGLSVKSLAEKTKLEILVKSAVLRAPLNQRSIIFFNMRDEEGKMHAEVINSEAEERGISFRYFMASGGSALAHGYRALSNGMAAVHLAVDEKRKDKFPARYQLQGGSFSTVWREYDKDGKSRIVKEADSTKDGGKLKAEAEYMQRLRAEEGMLFFPEIYSISQKGNTTTVVMEDIPGEELTQLEYWANFGNQHDDSPLISLQRKTRSRTSFQNALKVYESLVPFFQAHKVRDTPDNFLQEYHFDKLRKRLQAAADKSPFVNLLLASPYVKVLSYEREFPWLYPNIETELKLLEKLTSLYPEVFLPPYLSREHGDLHAGNVIIDPYAYYLQKKFPRFRLIDPKFMPGGNDPIYDFAKSLHNQFGHYDLALNWADGFHYDIHFPREPGKPTRLSYYMETDEYEGQMAESAVTSSFLFARDLHVYLEDIEKSPFSSSGIEDYAWRPRLLFTHATLLTGLLPFHAVNDDRERKVSVIYQQSLFHLHNTIDWIFYVDRKMRDRYGVGRISPQLQSDWDVLTKINGAIQLQRGSSEELENKYFESLQLLQQHLSQGARLASVVSMDVWANFQQGDTFLPKVVDLAIQICQSIERSAILASGRDSLTMGDVDLDLSQAGSPKAVVPGAYSRRPDAAWVIAIIRDAVATQKFDKQKSIQVDSALEAILGEKYESVSLLKEKLSQYAAARDSAQAPALVRAAFDDLRGSDREYRLTAWELPGQHTVPVDLTGWIKRGDLITADGRIIGNSRLFYLVTETDASGISALTWDYQTGAVAAIRIRSQVVREEGAYPLFYKCVEPAKAEALIALMQRAQMKAGARLAGQNGMYLPPENILNEWVFLNNAPTKDRVLNGSQRYFSDVSAYRTSNTYPVDFSPDVPAPSKFEEFDNLYYLLQKKPVVWFDFGCGKGSALSQAVALAGRFKTPHPLYVYGSDIIDYRKIPDYAAAYDTLTRYKQKDDRDFNSARRPESVIKHNIEINTVAEYPFEFIQLQHGKEHEFSVPQRPNFITAIYSLNHASQPTQTLVRMLNLLEPHGTLSVTMEIVVDADKHLENESIKMAEKLNRLNQKQEGLFDNFLYELQDKGPGSFQEEYPDVVFPHYYIVKIRLKKGAETQFSFNREVDEFRAVPEENRSSAARLADLGAELLLLANRDSDTRKNAADRIAASDLSQTQFEELLANFLQPAIPADAPADNDKVLTRRFARIATIYAIAQHLSGKEAKHPFRILLYERLDREAASGQSTGSAADLGHAENLSLFENLRILAREIAAKTAPPWLLNSLQMVSPVDDTIQSELLYKPLEGVFLKPRRRTGARLSTAERFPALALLAEDVLLLTSEPNPPGDSTSNRARISRFLEELQKDSGFIAFYNEQMRQSGKAGQPIDIIFNVLRSAYGPSAPVSVSEISRIAAYQLVSNTLLYFSHQYAVEFQKIHVDVREYIAAHLRAANQFTAPLDKDTRDKLMVVVLQDEFNRRDVTGRGGEVSSEAGWAPLFQAYKSAELVTQFQEDEFYRSGRALAGIAATRSHEEYFLNIINYLEPLPEKRRQLFELIMRLQREIYKNDVMNDRSKYYLAYNYWGMMAAGMFDPNEVRGVNAAVVKNRLLSASLADAYFRIHEAARIRGYSGETADYYFSGPDVSTALLLTDAATLNFKDALPFKNPFSISASDLDELKRFYFMQKATHGYSLVHILDTLGGAEYPILWELEALGATDIRVTEVAGSFVIEFNWSYDGDAKNIRPRKLIYTQKRFEKDSDFEEPAGHQAMFYIRKGDIERSNVLRTNAPVIVSLESMADVPGYERIPMPQLLSLSGGQVFAPATDNTRYANIFQGSVFIRNDKKEPEAAPLLGPIPVETVEKIFGPFKVAPTLAGFLNSMGSFGDAPAIRQAPSTDSALGGYLSFVLSEQGQQAVYDLMRAEIVTSPEFGPYLGEFEKMPDKGVKKLISKAAYVLTYKTASAQMPYGILVYLANGPVLIDIWELYSRADSDPGKLRSAHAKWTSSAAEFIKTHRDLFAEHQKLSSNGLNGSLVLRRWIRVPEKAREAKNKIDKRPYQDPWYSMWDSFETLPAQYRNPEKYMTLFSVTRLNRRGDESLVVMDPNISASADWQEFLARLASGAQGQPNVFSGKNVAIAGAGTLADGLLVAKSGANIVRCTDIFQAYVMLARLNVQYARDNGYLSENQVIEVEKRDGLPSKLDDVDYALMNTPGVNMDDDPAFKPLMFQAALFKSTSIPWSDFYRIFGQFETFIQAKPSRQAFLRMDITPTFLDGTANPGSIDQIQRFMMEKERALRIRQMDPRQQFFQISKKDNSGARLTLSPEDKASQLREQSWKLITSNPLTPEPMKPEDAKQSVQAFKEYVNVSHIDFVESNWEGLDFAESRSVSVTLPDKNDLRVVFVPYTRLDESQKQAGMALFEIGGLLIGHAFYNYDESQATVYPAFGIHQEFQSKFSSSQIYETFLKCLVGMYKPEFFKVQLTQVLNRQPGTNEKRTIFYLKQGYRPPNFVYRSLFALADEAYIRLKDGERLEDAIAGKMVSVMSAQGYPGAFWVSPWLGNEDEGDLKGARLAETLGPFWDDAGPAFRDGNREAIRRMLERFGPGSSGTVRTLSADNRFRLFRDSDLPGGKAIYVYIAGYGAKRVRFKVELDANGRTLWLNGYDAETGVQIYRHFYHQGSKMMIERNSRDHARWKVLDRENSPDLTAAVRIDRQTNEAANYFFFKDGTKSVNLARSTDGRFEGINTDPATATIYVRLTQGKAQTIAYAFLDPNEKKLGRAIAKWIWNAKARKFIPSYFYAPGSPIWFDRVLRGKYQAASRHYRLIETGDNWILVYKGLYFSIESFYSRALPPKAVISNSTADPIRLDVHSYIEGEKGFGPFNPSGRLFLGSKFFNSKTNRLEKPAEEIARRELLFRLSKAADPAPLPILINTSKGPRATGNPTRVFTDSNDRPVYIAPSEKLVFKPILVRFVRVNDGPKSYRGLELVVLDRNTLEPLYVYKRGYTHKDGSFYWIDTRKPIPMSADEKAIVGGELAALNYLDSNPLAVSQKHPETHRTTEALKGAADFQLFLLKADEAIAQLEPQAKKIKPEDLSALFLAAYGFLEKAFIVTERKEAGASAMRKDIRQREDKLALLTPILLGAHKKILERLADEDERGNSSAARLAVNTKTVPGGLTQSDESLRPLSADFGKPSGRRFIAPNTLKHSAGNWRRLQILSAQKTEDMYFSFREKGAESWTGLFFEGAASGGKTAVFYDWNKNENRRVEFGRIYLSPPDVAAGRELLKRHASLRDIRCQANAILKAQALQFIRQDRQDEQDILRLAKKLQKSGIAVSARPVVYLVDATALRPDTFMQFASIIAEREKGNPVYANTYFVFQGNEKAGIQLPVSDDIQKIARPTEIKLVFYGEAGAATTRKIQSLAKPIIDRYKIADARVGFAPIEAARDLGATEAPHYRVAGIVLTNALLQRTDLRPGDMAVLRSGFKAQLESAIGHDIADDRFTFEGLRALQEFSESYKPTIYIAFAARPMKVNLEIITEYAALKRQLEMAA